MSGPWTWASMKGAGSVLVVESVSLSPVEQNAEMMMMTEARAGRAACSMVKGLKLEILEDFQMLT